VGPRHAMKQHSRDRQACRQAAEDARRDPAAGGRGLALAPPGGPGLAIQPKLTLGAADDRYEQEADRAARQVLEQLGAVGGPAGLPAPAGRGGTVPSPPGVVQRLSDGGGAAVEPFLEAEIRRARAAGAPLAADVRGPMERAFGADFGG